MILIVGLGNPGLQYSLSRHNAGFMGVDVISSRLGFPDFVLKSNSLLTEKIIDSEKFILQKPQTFMNLSGVAVREIVSFYKIPTDNVFVIHDDIDLKPLEIKMKLGGSSGGHNGLRNIDSAIGKNYWRIRIGAGRPLEKVDVSSYVLSKFYKDELQKLSEVFDSIADNICEIASAADKTAPIKKMLSEANRFK